MRRRSPHLTLASGLLLLGCQGMPGVPTVQDRPAQQVVFPRLQGRVDFPGVRQTAATTGDIVSRATVSILDAAGQTVAATITDGAGAFTLDVNGSFTPVSGAYYTVEAIKGLASATTASNAVRMRTLLQWTGTAWTSCTGATITLNPTTTAVALIKAKLSTVGYPETMGIVSGTSVTSGNATLNANWQAVRDMVSDLLWRDLDPVARIGLNGSTFAVLSDRAVVVSPPLDNGAFSNTWELLDGSVQLVGALPRPKTNTEVTFSVAGLTTNAAVVATDGSYVYTKTWDGADVWNKVGTGFSGTTQGANLGTYANAMTSGNGAGCYGGYLYQVMAGTGNNGTLHRLNLSNGTLDTVTLGSPAIFRDTGLSTGSGALCYLHSDGTFLYNGSYTINNGGMNGYTVRVYDPANAFALVRQIYLDGSNTPYAGTSYYTDGMFYDGVYAYALEWVGTAGGMARLRRFRLADGQLEIETTVAQNLGIDDPITGSYDRVNNKFWFGDHRVGIFHRTAGRVFPASGTWTSSAVDLGSATPLYGRLNFNAVAVNGQTVRLQIRSANDPQALSTATWYGPTGTSDLYTTSGTQVNPVHNRNRWVQIRATLTPDNTAMLANSGPLAAGGNGPSQAANTTPRLYGVSLEVTP